MSQKFTPEELSAFKTELCKGASEAQFQLFIAEAEARDLRPGVHLFFQLRSASEWDPDVRAKVKVSKATWITTIAALRLISQRTGQDAGRGKTRWIYLDEHNRPTIESTIPLPHPDNPQLPREPYACVVPIYRKDYREPVEVVCRFEAYAVTVKTDNGPVLTEMWARRGPEQLEKCTEAATRRATYPESLGSLYLAEEFKSEQEEERPTPVTPASVMPPAPVVPKVDHTPAVGTDAPRPGVWSKPVLTTNIKTVTVREDYPPTIEAEIVPATPTPSPAAVEAAKAAVPDLKPASEIPPPDKKKPGRKPKPSPGNGQPVELGITQADIDAPPAPPVEPSTAAAEFVETLDPTPTPDELKVFYQRVRALETAGAKMPDIKNYLLTVGNTTEIKSLTVGNWNTGLGEMEAAQKSGTLKEVTAKAVLPKL